MSSGARIVRRRGEQGYALLFVFALAAAMAMYLYLQLPRVAFEAQRNKEELLIARGEQYQRGIQLFARKFRRLPQRLEELENTNNLRFLRKRYKDPLTDSDEWRLVRAGPGGVLLDSLVQKPGQNPGQGTPEANTFTGGFEKYGIGGAPATGAGNDPTSALINRDRLRGTGGGLPGAGGPVPTVPPGEPDGMAATPPQVTPGGAPMPGPLPTPDGTPPIRQGGAAGPQPVPGEEPPPPPDPNDNSSPEPPPLDGRPLPVNPPASGAEPPPGAPRPPVAVPGLPIVPGSGNPRANPGAGPQPVRPTVPSGIGNSNYGGIGSSLTPAGGSYRGPNPGALAIENNLRTGTGTGPTVGPQGLPPGAAQAGAVAGVMGRAQLGPGIVGIASKHDATSIRIYNEQTNHKLWEFIYDPAKERRAGQQGSGLPGVPNPGNSQGSNPPSGPR